MSTLAFVVGDTGIVAVDVGSTPAASAGAIDELRRHNDLPLLGIIYTHHHFDHTYGAVAFTEENPYIQIWAIEPFGGEPRWAAELCDMLLALGFELAEVTVLKADALDAIAYDMVTATGCNDLHSCAREFRESFDAAGRRYPECAGIDGELSLGGVWLSRFRGPRAVSSPHTPCLTRLANEGQRSAIPSTASRERKHNGQHRSSRRTRTAHAPQGPRLTL